MVAVMEGKVVFGRDQVVTSTQASKNFGQMKRRAQAGPLFVSGRDAGIDTVIISFDDFEAMATELEQLREQRFYDEAARRVREADADPNHEGIPVEECMSAEELAAFMSAAEDDDFDESELFE